MVRVPASEGVLAGCRACGGTWADTAISTILITGELGPRGRAFAAEITAAARGAAPAGYRARAAGAERRCPSCRERLLERPYGDPPVLIDVCNTHGTFFDVRELEHAVRHVDMMIASAQAAAEVAAFEIRYARAQSDWYGANDLRGPLDAVWSLIRLFR